MEIFLLFVVGFLSFIVGTFGFCQIVGTIKYFRNFAPVSALITILIWTVILGFGAFAVIKWLNAQATALYIGYGIAFVMSLRTKPD